MGQYYLIANLDKKEFLGTHPFGAGRKLCEFITDPLGPMAGLALLLADGCGRGGGDLRYFKKDEDGTDTEVDAPSLVGAWKGNRIVVAGDYADSDQYGLNHDNVYEIARNSWEDISTEVIEALASGDPYMRRKLLERDVIDAAGRWIGPPWMRERHETA